MSWLITLATRLGVPQRFAKAAAMGALIVAVVLAALIGIRLHDRRVISDHDTRQEADALRAGRKATDEAADERAADIIAIARKDQETRDAIQAQPDQPIAPTSRALACQRLRNAGRDVPACR